MNKVYLFVLVLLFASFTGCIESEDLPIEEEDSSNIEDEPKYSTISRTTEYDSLDDCPNGGVIIEYGIDENGNGTLDDAEVDGDVVICHGQDGQGPLRGPEDFCFRLPEEGDAGVKEDAVAEVQLHPAVFFVLELHLVHVHVADADIAPNVIPDTKLPPHLEERAKNSLGIRLIS